MSEDSSAHQRINREDFEEAFKNLPEKEQDLLGRYAGIFGYDHTYIQVLADELNISAQEVDEKALEITKKLSKSVRRTARTIKTWNEADKQRFLALIKEVE